MNFTELSVDMPQCDTSIPPSHVVTLHTNMAEYRHAELKVAKLNKTHEVGK